jgi:hypothetical protein
MPEIVTVEQIFKDQIEKFHHYWEGLDLNEQVKDRISKATMPMLAPSSSDRLHKFIERYGLDREIFRAWKKSRNPSAHGDFLDFSKFPLILERRVKVLYLSHAIVLAFTGYTGPHTRYDRPGYRTIDWPLVDAAVEVSAQR